MIDYSIAIRGIKPGVKKENIDDTRAFAVAQRSKTLTLQEFAKHIEDHGCKYSRGDVQAVLTYTADCLREELLEGNFVQLGDLGTFGFYIVSKGVEKAEELDSRDFTAVRVSWDKGKAFENLLGDATFRLVPSRLSQKLAKEEERAQTTIVKKPVLS